MKICLCDKQMEVRVIVLKATMHTLGAKACKPQVRQKQAVCLNWRRRKKSFAYKMYMILDYYLNLVKTQLNKQKECILHKISELKLSLCLNDHNMGSKSNPYLWRLSSLNDSNTWGTLILLITNIGNVEQHYNQHSRSDDKGACRLMSSSCSIQQ